MTKHPAENTLQAFAAGTLPDLDMDRIGEHVQECGFCADRVDKLSSIIEPLAAQLGAKLLRRLPPEQPQTQLHQPKDVPTPDQGLADAALFSGGQTSSRRAPWDAHQLPVWFGRYRVFRQLGEGGMGVVYLADDTQLERQVALKIPFFDDKSGRDAIGRFYREAKAMATVSHPNLCPIYDVGDINGVHFLSMAYLEGHPLSDYLKQARRQPNRQIATVIRKLALALQSAHDVGIVHRDLKPDNILIRKDNEPVVTDFGLAIDEARSRLTHGRTLIGTLAYMSPEQVQGEAQGVGSASDIYALGVILYQMICGKLPYEGSLSEVVKQITKGQLQAPRQIRSDVNGSLEAICLKAMAKNVSHRYPSAALMADDLGRFLKGQVPDALAASKAQPAKEFTVECPLCSTRLVVTRAQIGQPVRCQSCQSWAVVERPVALQQPDSADVGRDEREGATAATPMLRATVPGRDSARWNRAAAALRQAEAAPRQEQISPVTGASFFLDGQLLVRWFTLSLALQFEAALLDTVWLIGAFGGAVLFVAIGVTGLVILRDAARGADRVLDWPTFHVAEWIYGATPVVSSTMVALLLGWMFGYVLTFYNDTARALGVPIVCGVSMATLFPVLLLSTLEVGSPIPSLSRRVLQSLRQVPSRWTRFLAKSTCLVAVSMLIWRTRAFGSTLANFFAAAVVIAAILLCSYLMGRLLSKVAPGCVERVEATRAFPM